MKQRFLMYLGVLTLTVGLFLGATKVSAINYISIGTLRSNSTKTTQPAVDMKIYDQVTIAGKTLNNGGYVKITPQDVKFVSPGKIEFEVWYTTAFNSSVTSSVIVANTVFLGNGSSDTMYEERTGMLVTTDSVAHRARLTTEAVSGSKVLKITLNTNKVVQESDVKNNIFNATVFFSGFDEVKKPYPCSMDLDMKIGLLDGINELCLLFPSKHVATGIQFTVKNVSGEWIYLDFDAVDFKDRWIQKGVPVTLALGNGTEMTLKFVEMVASDRINISIQTNTAPKPTTPTKPSCVRDELFFGQEGVVDGINQICVPSVLHHKITGIRFSVTKISGNWVYLYFENGLEKNNQWIQKGVPVTIALGNGTEMTLKFVEMVASDRINISIQTNTVPKPTTPTTTPTNKKLTQISKEDLATLKVKTLTFEDASTYPGLQYVQTDGIRFTEVDSMMYRLNNYNRGEEKTVSGQYSIANNANWPKTSANQPMTIRFDSGVSAVGFYLGNGSRYGQSTKATITAYDKNGTNIGSFMTGVIPNPTTYYVGFKTTVPVYKVSIDYGNTLLSEEIDNLMYVR